MTISEKIKSLRMQKGMTQARLASGCVTRNMISRIEAGIASPSLETLCHIAQKLGVPAGYFLSEQDDAFPFVKSEKMPPIRASFAKGDHARAERLLEALPGEDDETAFLLALCKLELGMEATVRGALQTAKRELTGALSAADRTHYPTGRVRLLAPLYLAIADNIQAPLLEFDQEQYVALLHDRSQYEFFRYVTQDYSEPFSDELLEKHAEARRLLRAKRDYDAYRLLSGIENDFASAGYHAYIMFSVYTDLEQCCKTLGDFEGAYRYSTKRMSLLEGFKS